MGRTIPSWRIVLDEELTRLTRFRQFLRPEDRIVFDDLTAQCRLYAWTREVAARKIHTGTSNIRNWLRLAIRRIRDNPTLVQQLAAMVKNQNGKEKEGMSESAQQGRPVQ